MKLRSKSQMLANKSLLRGEPPLPIDVQDLCFNNMISDRSPGKKI